VFDVALKGERAKGSDGVRGLHLEDVGLKVPNAYENNRSFTYSTAQSQ